MDLVVDRLEKLGLKKRQGLIFTWELPGTENAIGWLGLNRATQGLKKGEAMVHPIIGVRHHNVERLVAEMRAEKFHSYRPPTYCEPLYCVMPQRDYIQWDVTSTSADAQVAEDLANAVEQYGYPFLRSLADLSGLITAFEAKKILHQQDILRLPAALFLAGNLARATVVIERELLKLGHRTNTTAVQHHVGRDALIAASEEAQTPPEVILGYRTDAAGMEIRAFASRLLEKIRTAQQLA